MGDYPPPYGGISVQIAFLARALPKTAGWIVRVLDVGASRRRPKDGAIGARNPIDVMVKLVMNSDRGGIIHVITSGHNAKSWLLALVCTIVGRMTGRRVLVTLASGRSPTYIETSGPCLRLLCRLVARWSDRMICRNERTVAALVRLGLKAHQTAVLSGFFGVLDYRSIALPDAIQNFLDRHEPVLGTIVAYRPEYGISLLIDAFSDIVPRYPRAGLMILGSGSPDQRALVERSIAAKGLDDAVLLAGEVPHEVAGAIMRRMSVFVRATQYDGDSVSVREALELGIPTVASRTDFRPEGVRLFEIGDRRGLVSQVEGAIRERPVLKRRGQSFGQENLSQLLALYRCVLDEHA